jgi:hypothetical protein
MRHYFCIGASPCEEDCAQVGQLGYRKQALAECERFIQRIRDAFGPEPEGAALAIKSFDHDFGVYYEVVCWFDSENEAAQAYALRCDSDAPATWEG